MNIRTRHSSGDSTKSNDRPLADRKQQINKSISIFLIDDQPVFITGLKAVLKNYPDIIFSGSISSGREALKKINSSLPDVILVGLNKPYMNGFGDIILIKKKLPNSKILALSIHDNEHYVMEIIRLGASGYLLKDSHPDEISSAIKSVYNNSPYYSPSIKNSILKQLANMLMKSKKSFLTMKLSRRETDVLIQIANGFSNKEIAKFLNISVRTVETHREHITQKLNIKTVAELTKFAISKGLTDINNI